MVILDTYLQVMQPVRDLPFETLRLDPVMLQSGIRGQAYGSLLAREAGGTRPNSFCWWHFAPVR